MVPGMSARGFAKLMEYGSNAGLALLGILLVGMIASGAGYVASPVLSIVMVLILADVFLFLTPVTISEAVRRRNELRAGYATVTNQYQQVDQIDPKTARVVRLAGEDLLNREEYLERIGRIRNILATDRRYK